MSRPFPSVTAKVTVTPATGLPSTSVTVTAGRMLAKLPKKAPVLGTVLPTIDAGVARTPVAVNTAEPPTPVTVASRRLAPGVTPRIHPLARAMPSAPVTFVGGRIEPPPWVT